MQKLQNHKKKRGSEGYLQEPKTQTKTRIDEVKMARIAGITLPSDKRIEIGLTYIYGIGRSRSKRILEKVRINKDKKVKDLTEGEINRIRKQIEQGEKIEGDLRKEVSGNIKRLIEISAYRGMRHQKNLPVRGQRTKTNARTRKGPTQRKMKR